MGEEERQVDRGVVGVSRPWVGKLREKQFPPDGVAGADGKTCKPKRGKRKAGELLEEIGLDEGCGVEDRPEWHQDRSQGQKQDVSQGHLTLPSPLWTYG